MKKFLIIFTLFLILLVIGGAGGLFWYLQQKDEAKTMQMEKQMTPKDEILSDIGPLYPLKPFHINLHTITISLELSDTILSNELDAKNTKIHELITQILIHYSQDVIISQKGKKEICAKITQQLNAILKDGQIKNVYIATHSS